MNRRAWGVTIGTGLLGLVFLVAAFWLLIRPASKSTKSDESTIVKLRLKWQHQGQFAGFYCAQERGFYEDEGMKVQIRPGGQEMNALNLVTGGTDDIGVWGAEQLLIARSHDIPVKAIGVVYQESAACFLSRPEAGIKNPKDFEGKRVGTQSGTDLETIYRALLNIGHVDRAKIHETNVSFNFALFLAGEYDVWPSYIVNEPYIAQQRGVAVSVLQPKDFDLHFYGDTIFARDDYLKNNPEVVRKFMRASKRGWAFALEHPEVAAELCLKYDQTLSKEAQLFMIEQSKNLIQPAAMPLFKMSDDRWLGMHKVLRDQQLLARDVSVSEVYTNDFQTP